MTISPARAHFLRKTAAAAAVAAAAPAATVARMAALAGPASGGADATTLAPAIARMQARLVSDTDHLKRFKSVKSKIDHKRKILPEYAPYVAGVLAANVGGDDAIISTVMIWHLDVGDWSAGLELADYAIRHKLTMPERFARSVPELVLETVAEAAQKAIDTKTADKAIAEALDRAMILTDGADMPDIIRAKAGKAAGLLLMNDNPAEALKHLRLALGFDPAIGVKKVITQLEKDIQQPEPQDTGENAG